MSKHRKVFRSIKSGSKRGLFAALELAKGVTAESRTLALLNGTHKPHWLKEARPTPEKDKFGVDIELCLADNETIVPINIKSSERGLFDHIQKRKKLKARFVLVLIVRPFDTDEQIIKRLASALLRYKKGKDRHEKGITKPSKK